jgi:hypothetical protein
LIEDFGLELWDLRDEIGIFKIAKFLDSIGI